MAKKSSLKKSLLVSALSLTLSASMLVGTTFAWFTDSVTNAGNKIQAGTLDIDLYDVTTGTENEITESSAPLFNYGKWEPGYKASKVLKVKNNGTLALKFKLDVVKTASVGTADICDVIEVWATAPATTYDVSNYEWQTDYTYCGTLNQMMAESDGAIHGTLLEGESAYQGIVLKMSEEAGNEYQGAVAEFDIRLNATQFTNESDSYDDQYDAGADYFGEASNEASLKAALESGTNVKLLDDIEITERINIPEDAQSILDMNGFTINNSTASHVIYSKGDLTITGTGTVNTTGSNYGIRAQSGKLTIDSANVNVVGTFGAISAFNGAEVTINGGSYTSTGTAGSTHHCIYVGSGANVVVNDGTFIHNGAGISDSGAVATVYDYNGTGNTSLTINGGTFIGSGYIPALENYSATKDLWVKGGTFSTNPTSYLASDGYKATQNADGTWTVSRAYVEAPDVTNKEDEVANGSALADAINNSTKEEIFLDLKEGEYKMPSITGNKNFTIVGDENTVIDVTLGAYMDSSTVAFEGVTIKGSTGKANGNGSDYAALYTPNVTYTNCTFDGPFRIGRDGATFINCKFTNLGNDYVWTYGNDATFKGCTFESEGKALLIYSDGGSEVAKVVVENCVFNATQGGKAGAISNQNCAAIEIDNYGNGVDLVTSGNTFSSNFSGEWRIKRYVSTQPSITVNGVTYTSLALDGKLMTISGTEVTVQ